MQSFFLIWQIFKDNKILFFHFLMLVLITCLNNAFWSIIPAFVIAYIFFYLKQEKKEKKQANIFDTGISNYNKYFKNNISRIVILIFLVILCLFLIYYFDYVKGIKIVFTHFFYVPIIISSFWFGSIGGIGTSLVLSLSLLCADYIFFAEVFTQSIFRSSMFLLIALIIGKVYEKEKQAEEVINYQSNYDIVTGLPNRTLLKDILTRLLSESKKNKNLIGIFSIDIRGFTNINDVFGYENGNILLKSVSERLKAKLDMPYVIARTGNDEFQIIINNLCSKKDVEKIANRINDSFKEYLEINEKEIYTTVNIGISIFPYDGEDAEVLLQNSDIALKFSKNVNDSLYTFYSQEMNQNITENVKIVNLLRQTIEYNRYEDFLVFYQPQVEVESNRIVGVEALLRWENSELGFQTPDKFIPLAEISGLIVPIGEWVLRSVCLQIKKWQDQGLKNFVGSVNVSKVQLHDENFVENVKRILEETGLAPNSLELEITESLTMSNPEMYCQKLNLLKRLGVRVALDDFGKGYSSLTYLEKLPIDVLKLDRGFINNIKRNPKNIAIAKAVFLLAHELNLKVTGEGVETSEQLDFLKNNKCDYFQGYLFSKPLPMFEVEKLLIKK